MTNSKKIDFTALSNIETSTTRRLEALMPEIEKYIAQGALQKDIVQLLNRQGFDINLNYFKNMLKLIRKRQNKKPISNVDEKSTSVDETQSLDAVEVFESDIDKNKIESKPVRRKPIITIQEKQRFFHYDPHSNPEW